MATLSAAGRLDMSDTPLKLAWNVSIAPLNFWTLPTRGRDKLDTDIDHPPGTGSVSEIPSFWRPCPASKVAGADAIDPELLEIVILSGLSTVQVVQLTSTVADSAPVGIWKLIIDVDSGAAWPLNATTGSCATVKLALLN